MDLQYKIPYLIMNVKMRAADGEAGLPVWFSSAVRGALGTEMLAAFCRCKVINCTECTEKCSAGILYAGDPHHSNEQAISPYVISGDSFDGENLEFRITLFSEGVRVASDVISVLRKGLRLGAGRSLFELVSVTDNETDEVIFDGLIQTEPVIHYFVFEDHKTSESIKAVRVDFITPFRTKVSANQFSFETLIRASLRRISAVLKLSGETPEIDYEKLLHKAETVETEIRKFRTHKTQRYSNRSGSHMDVTGFTGYAVYRGDIAEFMPLFRFAEIINLGKLCVMGLGEIKVTVL